MSPLGARGPVCLETLEDLEHLGHRSLAREFSTSTVVHRVTATVVMRDLSMYTDVTHREARED